MYLLTTGWSCTEKGDSVMSRTAFYHRFLEQWKLFAVVLSVIAAIGAAIPFAMSDTEESGSANLEQENKNENISRYEEFEKELKNFDERAAAIRKEQNEQRKALQENIESQPSKKTVRRIRRFQWESPADTRGHLWNVPEEESEEAVLTAFLRVCFAEASGKQQDCIGIWQVVKNNRWRTCDRSMIRRISECEEGEGETFLSALRRHQRHALGLIKARNKRATWIRNMTIDCEDPPEGFPGKTEQEKMDVWDASYQNTCSNIVADGRYLLKGELPPARPGNTAQWLTGWPITWGGRCESGKGACDDKIACSRGLARIQETNTLNAFWCRPNAPGCSDDIDEICLKLGFPSLKESEEEPTEAVSKAESSEEVNDTQS